MEADARRVAEILVGLKVVEVLGAEETAEGRVTVWVRLRERPVCEGCGGGVWSKGLREVGLSVQGFNGQRARLVWVKRRWQCPDVGCGAGSFTDQDPRIAPVRGRLTARAARWAVAQVGRFGRTVSEVAWELGCDWHTVSKEVNRWGEALLREDEERVGEVEALGLDETMFQRQGPRRRRMWITAAVDLRRKRLIDVFPGKDAKGAVRWMDGQPQDWREGIRWASIDLSSAYRSTLRQALPGAVQIADPFHVVRLANLCVDQTRRRVQEETLGRRGRKGDDLYRIRKLLLLASERLDGQSNGRLAGLLRAGDPHGEVKYAWYAKETVRYLYQKPYPDPDDADRYVRRLAEDFQEDYLPPEVHQLGRTIRTWHDQIVAWNQAQISNGPTESINNLIKRVKRVAFGFRNYRNYRTRILLYAGKPNWNLLPTITPP